MATESAFAAGFDEAGFREAIRETMKMGMPESDAEKLRWWWYADREYDTVDEDDNPYDWTQPADTGTPSSQEDPEGDGLVIDYAFDFNANSATEFTAVGPIDPSKIVVTIFDVDYHRIKDADYATIGDTRYRIRFDAAPYGLFGVTMHDIHLEAEDQAATA